MSKGRNALPSPASLLALQPEVVDVEHQIGPGLVSDGIAGVHSSGFISTRLPRPTSCRLRWLR